MTATIEIVLLVVALAAIGLLIFDFLRSPLRRRGTRARLERMAGDDEEVIEEELPEVLQPMERRLRAAGFPLGPIGFLALLLILGLLVFLALIWVFPTAPIAALIGATVIMYVAHLAVQEWGRFRARRFEHKLVDAVDHMVSALMAGEVPVRAIGSAASASEGAVRTELGEVVSRLGLGLDIRQALDRILLRYDSEGTRLFCNTLAVKWHAGGDLAPVLRSVAWIMRERIRLGVRLRAELTGVQLSALVIAVLPYLLIPFFIWRAPNWMRILTEHPLGPSFLLIAVILQVIGLLWLRRIVRIEL